MYTGPKASHRGSSRVRQPQDRSETSQPTAIPFSRTVAVGCDVSDRSAVAELVTTAVDAFGPVYVFCSNAGIGEPGPDLGSTEAQVDRIVGVNLLADVWAVQEVVPAMIDEGEGYLVQTLSSAVLITGPSGMGYTSTKHGVRLRGNGSR